MLTLQSTVAEFKALANEYGIELTGDGRKKETKQRWIDEIKAIQAVKSQRPDDHQIMVATQAYAVEGESDHTGQNCFEFVRDRLNQPGMACSDTFLYNRVRKLTDEGSLEKTSVDGWRLSAKGVSEMMKQNKKHQLYVAVLDGKAHSVYNHSEYTSGVMYANLNRQTHINYIAIVSITPFGSEVVSSVSSKRFDRDQTCAIAKTWKNPQVQTAIAHWQRHNLILDGWCQQKTA